MMKTTTRCAAAALAVSAAATIAAGPVSAAPAAPPAIPGVLLDLIKAGSSGGGPVTPPPNVVRPGSNGVASISATLSNYYGKKYGPERYSTGFAPGITYSARDRANAEVKGDNCRVEVIFVGTSNATYKSANCQGSIGFSSKYYRTPGAYTIQIVDRVSGASTFKPFVIE